MWLMTTFGFFSVVQKPGEELLTVRARAAADLHRLRKRMPALQPTIEGGGTDYPYRARVSRAEYALAMVDVVRDLDYSNFKNAVAKEMGSKRSHVYHGVWSTLLGITANEVSAKPQVVTSRAVSEGSPHTETTTKTRAYGGVVLRRAYVLLRRPAGDYDGYVWTFAKGKPHRDEEPEATALREVQAETGVGGVIIGELPGWFESGLSATRFYVMESVSTTGVWDDETQAVEWVLLEEADEWVKKTTNARGRARDLAVLAAVRKFHRETFGDS